MIAPLVDHGGTGPVVHLAPANGFPFATYQPLIDAVAVTHRIVSIPPRALWPQIGPPPNEPGTWDSLALDFIEGLAAHRLDRVIGIGHSFGAVASILAALREPSLFRGLVLLDPTLLPPWLMTLLGDGRRSGQRDWHPLAAKAKERRNEFADRTQAFADWRGRSAFADWSEAMLWRYVDGILRPNGAGGMMLEWSPQWEAHYYESIDTEAWDKLASLTRTIPILLLGGSTSDAFTAECRAKFANLVPWAETAVIEGGHLFPQSSPEATAAAVAGWLSRLETGAIPCEPN